MFPEKNVCQRVKSTLILSCAGFLFFLDCTNMSSKIRLSLPHVNVLFHNIKVAQIFHWTKCLTLSPCVQENCRFPVCGGNVS